MSRIARTFERLKSERRTGLIPYITAGDPDPSRTVGFMHALVEAGGDLVELGVPFSDPMADGPVIQLACERALAHGTSLSRVCDMVAEFRDRNAETPVVLMGYLNPVESFGLDAFARRAAQAGVDGVLLVDLSVEEAPEYAPVLRQAGLDAIQLVAPTTSPERIASIGQVASGYLYYVSLKGVTGASTLDAADVGRKVGEIRRSSTLPVAVGFGVRDADTARSVAGFADAVVVGSALVGEVERHAGQPDRIPGVLRQRLGAIRSALDGV